MDKLKERLEKIWADTQVRNPLKKVHWFVADHTNLPAVKRKKRGKKRIVARLTKAFSWRK
jgi:hypothetical protein